MKRALFSGSFDPITRGHVEIVERARRLFDEVYVVAFINSEKAGMFTPDERLDIIRDAVCGMEGVFADTYSGTVAEYVREKNIDVIVRGVRSPIDCQYEIESGEVNRRLSGVDTVMLACGTENSRTSSTLLREMLRIGQPISEYADARCEEKILSFFNKKK